MLVLVFTQWKYQCPVFQILMTLSMWLVCDGAPHSLYLVLVRFYLYTCGFWVESWTNPWDMWQWWGCRDQCVVATFSDNAKLCIRRLWVAFIAEVSQGCSSAYSFFMVDPLQVPIHSSWLICWIKHNQVAFQLFKLHHLVFIKIDWFCTFFLNRPLQTNLVWLPPFRSLLCKWCRTTYNGC